MLFAIADSHKSLYPTSWTLRNSELGFVVRLPADYNANEPYVFDGGDLFGNFTPQPPPNPGYDANGYAALAIWDSVENGGNANGLIDLKDQAVEIGIAPGGIVIWVDANHDGVAQPLELHTFAEIGLDSIDVSNYHRSQWMDSNGNKFRYTAEVAYSDGRKRASFDVFFTIGKARSEN